MLLTGTVSRGPIEPDRPVDVYDIVDVLRSGGRGPGLADVRLVAGPAAGFDAARGADVTVDGAVIGHVGEVAPTGLVGFGIPVAGVALELDIDGLMSGTRRDRAFRPLSRFPRTCIDLRSCCPTRCPPPTSSARCEPRPARCSKRCGFDEFRSEALGPGRRSLAFALRFRAPDRTLNDAEIAGLRQACIDAVIAAHDAELRA